MKRTYLIVIFLALSGLVIGVVACRQHIASTQLAPSQAVELAPLPITLPKPQFVGTPVDIAGATNMERPRGKPRPPFLAPANVTNVALHRSVTSSVPEPIRGELAWIVDGDKEANDGSLVELHPFLQHITIDLEAPHEIYAILFWHYHKRPRIYFDVAMQVADDPAFSRNARILFNNDHDNSSGLGPGTDRYYVETSKGRLVDAKGIKARFVRLYSRGNHANDQNHYLEVEVYGRPVVD